MNKFASKALLVSATLGLASVALADTTIYVTGSTAFRAQVYNTLTSTTVGGKTLFDRDGSYTANPNFNGSKNQFIVQGHISALGITNQLVTVSCGFSGSVEGIVAALGLTQPANAVLNNYIATVSSATATVLPSTVTPDVTFSDCLQDTTVYTSQVQNALTEITDASGTGVGIIPFGVAGSTHVAPAISNVSHQALQTILGTGYTELKQFTGNVGDTNKVYLTGRYSLSGTRIITQADTGFGATQGSTLYTLQTNGVVGTTWTGVASSDTVNGGYNSGSGVTGLLKNAALNSPFIGYAGWPDLASASLTPYTYDGVTLSKTSVENGQYSLWSAEHLYVNASTIPDVTDATNIKVLFLIGNSNSDATLSNGFLGYLNTEIGAAANVVQVSAMHASRNADGGAITPQ